MANAKSAPLAYAESLGDAPSWPDAGKGEMASSFSSPTPVVFGLWPSVSPFTQAGQGSVPPVYSPPPFDLHAQYQALRPTLGERGAMPDPVHPELAPTLVAQAQAPPVPVNADGVVQAAID